MDSVSHFVWTRRKCSGCWVKRWGTRSITIFLRVYRIHHTTRPCGCGAALGSGLARVERLATKQHLENFTHHVQSVLGVAGLRNVRYVAFHNLLDSGLGVPTISVALKSKRQFIYDGLFMESFRRTALRESSIGDIRTIESQSDAPNPDDAVGTCTFPVYLANFPGPNDQVILGKRLCGKSIAWMSCPP